MKINESVKQQLLNVEEACKFLNIGRSSLFQIMNQGKIHGLKILNKRLYSIEELERFISEAQQEAEYDFFEVEEIHGE